MKDISFEIRIPRLPEMRLSLDWKWKIMVVLSLLAVAVAFVAGRYFGFTLVGTLILAYFAIALLWNITSRVAASLALFFLACTPVLLVFGNDALAETFAIYAYYFLVITVIGEILALKRENR